MLLGGGTHADAMPAMPHKGDLRRKQREYLLPNLATLSEEPLVILRGEGKYVWDDQVRQYLDAFGGILTVSLGQMPPGGDGAGRPPDGLG